MHGPVAAHGSEPAARDEALEGVVVIIESSSEYRARAPHVRTHLQVLRGGDAEDELAVAVGDEGEDLVLEERLELVA